jgi:hypothetical protein
MDISFDEPFSDDKPLRYETPRVAGGSLVAREQVSFPAPSPFDEPDHSPDAADVDPLSADDDARWDVFLPDDDEVDPLPEPGDFWFDDD